MNRLLRVEGGAYFCIKQTNQESSSSYENVYSAYCGGPD